MVWPTHLRRLVGGTDTCRVQAVASVASLCRVSGGTLGGGRGERAPAGGGWTLARGHFRAPHSRPRRRGRTPLPLIALHRFQAQSWVPVTPRPSEVRDHFWNRRSQRHRMESLFSSQWVKA